MLSDADLVTYYSARAAEYETVYDKPERQEDLCRLHEIVPAHFAARHVLEVACGTGYWTRLIASRAASVTACDLSPDVLALARARQSAADRVTFVTADAFALDQVPGQFDAAFAGFWWSHVPRSDLQRFLNGLHRRLSTGSRVMVLDNRFVAGSNHAITRTDDGGNTYQKRRLENGPVHEVLKNFPSRAEIAFAIGESGGCEPEIVEMRYYWYATYEVASRGC